RARRRQDRSAHHHGPPLSSSAVAAAICVRRRTLRQRRQDPLASAAQVATASLETANPRLGEGNDGPRSGPRTIKVPHFNPLNRNLPWARRLLWLAPSEEKQPWKNGTFKRCFFWPSAVHRGRSPAARPAMLEARTWRRAPLQTW